MVVEVADEKKKGLPNPHMPGRVAARFHTRKLDSFRFEIAAGPQPVREAHVAGGFAAGGEPAERGGQHGGGEFISDGEVRAHLSARAAA